MSKVIVVDHGPGLILRAIYFVVIGLWLSGVWATVAWVLCVSILGLPFGLWMLNRLPQITTLAPEDRELLIDESGGVVGFDDTQLPFLIRAIWFLAIGWWASAVWMSVAWALCAIWIGLPFGFWMFNRVPAIITLRR